MASTLELLKRLTDQRVEFVIVGGVACVMHGCSLVTDSGILDVLSEIAGLGDYDVVRRHAMDTQFGPVACRVLDLDALIRAKRALGRPTDVRAALELEAIRQRVNDGNERT